MGVYLDASILIAYLYQETDDENQVRQARDLFAAVDAARTEGTIAFYSLSELYGYVQTNYPEAQRNDVFRLSLANLFSSRLTIKPFVDRTEHEKLRRRFTLTDATDIPHVVAPLAFDCSAIITFDHHFQQVKNVISVFTPHEYLATLAQESGAG